MWYFFPTFGWFFKGRSRIRILLLKRIRICVLKLIWKSKIKRSGICNIVTDKVIYKLASFLKNYLFREEDPSWRNTRPGPIRPQTAGRLCTNKTQKREWLVYTNDCLSSQRLFKNVQVSGKIKKTTHIKRINLNYNTEYSIYIMLVSDPSHIFPQIRQTKTVPRK